MALTLNPKALYDIEVKDPSRALSIFMPYDLVIAAPRVVIDIGRFSLSVLSKMHVFPPASGEAHVSIGAFCQAAARSTIIVGGNHANSSLLNYSFGRYAEFFQHFMDGPLPGMAPANPVVIGDNVIISSNATVLDTAALGTGCVIGAGAVVTRPCEPFGIYGGVPARLVSSRFDERMANLYNQVDLPNISAHSLPALGPLTAALEAGKIGIEEFRQSVGYLPARPKIHLSASFKDGAVEIEALDGFSIGGRPIEDQAMVAQLKGYFAQPKVNPSALKWSPDIFYALGLY